MRKVLAFGLSVWACLAGSAVSAQDAPDTPGNDAKRVEGQCRHIDSDLTDWVFAAGYNVVGSHRCDFARVDWDREVSFFIERDGEERVAASFFGERDKAWDDLEISTVSIRPGETHKATGTCRHPRAEDVEPRRIRCFASYSIENTRHATLIEFSYDDPVWPEQGEISLDGKCISSGLRDAVLVPWVANQINAMPEVGESNSIECDRAVIQVDEAYAFHTAESANPMRFKGTPRGDRPGAIVLDQVEYADGSVEDVVVGSCVTFRHSDGYFIPICNAATGDPNTPNFVEAALTPDGEPIRWEEPE